MVFEFRCQNSGNKTCIIGGAELEYEIEKIKISNFAALLLCAFARNLIHTAIMQRPLS